MDNLYESLKDWCSKQNTDIYTVYNIVKAEIETEEMRKETQAFKSHRELIGKCYKHLGTYYKIISENANNSCRVSCLAFSEHPRFYFKNLFSKNILFSPHAGEFMFEGVHIEDVILGTKYKTIFGITDYTEITEEEFTEAYKTYCEELLQVDWRNGANGNKLLFDNEE